MTRFAPPFTRTYFSSVESDKFLCAFVDFANRKCPICHEELFGLSNRCKRCNIFWSPEKIYDSFLIDKLEEIKNENNKRS
jgi:hypothetical protein